LNAIAQDSIRIAAFAAVARVRPEELLAWWKQKTPEVSA